MEKLQCLNNLKDRRSNKNIFFFKPRNRGFFVATKAGEGFDNFIQWQLLK